MRVMGAIIRQVAARDRFFVGLAALACLLPFLGKPLNIDDPLYVWTAQRIHAHPTDYFGFRLNWYGTEQPFSYIINNPPGLGYTLALIASVLGWDERSLHAGMLLPALAAAIGMYALARRLCDAPLLAALVGIFTPTFLVSSTGLGCETLMLAFWLWAIALWIRGVDERHSFWLATSSLLITAATLSKYYAAGLLPLLAAYTLARGRSRFACALWLTVPVLLLGAFELVSRAVYGEGLLHSATSYALYARAALAPDLGSSVLAGLAFAGGTVASVFFFAPLLWGRWILLGALAAALLAAELAFAGHLSQLALREGGAIRWSVLAQTSLMMVAGLQLVALALRDLITRRDAGALLLALAVAGTLVFAMFLNWTVNSRSLLPLAPLGGVLVARGLARSTLATSGRRWIAFAALVPGAFLALVVASADDRLAIATRDAVASLTSRHVPTPDHAWFLGHWGFQYYMQRAGVHPLDLAQGHLATRDLLFAAENNSNKGVPWENVKVLEVLEIPIGDWISIWSAATHAGFHASEFGPIPFLIGRPPKERFLVGLVLRNMRGAGDQMVNDP